GETCPPRQERRSGICREAGGSVQISALNRVRAATRRDCCQNQSLSPAIRPLAESCPSDWPDPLQPANAVPGSARPSPPAARVDAQSLAHVDLRAPSAVDRQ